MRTPAFWQQENFLSRLLSPLSFLYQKAAAYDRTHTVPQHAPLPVISIGNVTAGGAGKTPTTLAIAEILRSMGQVPHLITRGYGGSTRVAHRVMPTDGWQLVGDEALLLARQDPTWVGRERIASAYAAKQAGASLVVADDALQHHALHKDISLLVIDGAYGLGNGRLLPAGPLRESLAGALTRADAVVLIGENRHNLTFSKPVFHATIVPVGDMEWLRGTRVLAFAGLARPQKFYDTLRGLGAELAITQDFPDHHPFGERDLEALCEAAAKADAIPIATAKDAVKFPPAYATRIHVLDVALHWADPAALQNWLQSRLPAPYKSP